MVNIYRDKFNARTLDEFTKDLTDKYKDFEEFGLVDSNIKFDEFSITSDP